MTLAEQRGGPGTSIVVLGASAGGVEALRALVAGLSPDLRACVLVVLHVPAAGRSVLPTILDRAGPLAARHAREGDLLEPGLILVAPPDRHLIVLGDRVTLSRGPRENGHRPAVDVLFRSAARAHGAAVVGVVLSGALDDGAAGMVAITQRGGTGIVQDFAEALYDSMPRAAHVAAGVDHVRSVHEIPELLDDLLREPAGPDRSDASPLMEMEIAMGDLDPEAMHAPDRPGTPAGLGCPDCAGALFLISEGGLDRFRCRVGHAWSPESLLAQQALALEGALWMALRSLEEKAALSDDMGERARAAGHRLTATRYQETAQEARGAAELVRKLITGTDASTAESRSIG